MRTPWLTSLFFVVVSSGCGGSGKATVADLGPGKDDMAVASDMAASADLAVGNLAKASDLAGDMTQGPPTFSGDIFPILQDQACFDCHMTNTWDVADNKTGQALVTYLTSTHSEECPSLPYVTPGSPTMSYLYQKVIGSGSCFVDDPMPDGTTGLDTKDANRIQAWILEGAPAN